MLDFLQERQRKKIVRTTLYGDQEFTLWELEILHTPLAQRLYHLKQLGFADKVFPDAVHSRFNHVLGVAEMADRMAARLDIWLEGQGDRSLTYAVDRTSSAEPKKTAEISCRQLRVHLSERRASIRLMALLHDITHAAFGHTLEDEVRIFTEKHDDAARQVRFFNGLVAQLVYIWLTENRVRQASTEVLQKLTMLSIDQAECGSWVDELREFLPEDSRMCLALRLRELEIAIRLLLRLEFAHGSEDRIVPPQEDLLVSDVIARLGVTIPPVDVRVHRDVFLIDMVGNTICADLLDYGRRDAMNAGLKVQFDERLIRYLTVVSVADDLSPTHEQCLRLALQFFTDKMRHDVLSEVSGVLKARYVINERVLFHPTKCAAGAVLGTAAQLLGIAGVPPWIQVLGDDEFIAELTNTADRLEIFCSTYEPSEDYVVGLSAIWGNSPHVAEFHHQCIQVITGRPSHVLSDAEVAMIRARAASARRLCWNLAARRLPKLAFRLRSGVHHSGGASDETIAKMYSEPGARYDLERRVEVSAGLPMGSVVVHCPRRQTSMKLAEVLVVGSSMSRVAKLRDVTGVSPEGLKPYQKEIRAIENMYLSIWQLHVFLESTFYDKHPILSWVLERELGFRNDQLLSEELLHQPESVYRVLATELRDEFAPLLMPQIVARIDSEASSVRMRHGSSKSDARAWLRSIIRSVTSGQGSQLRLPELDNK
jgi:HD superfamily phosphohydrolase